MLLRCIILTLTKYNDASFIAEAYSKTEGRCAFLVKISHNAHSAVRHTVFQPMALLDVECADNHKSGQLWRPKSAHVVLREVACQLPHPIRSSIALFLAEFLHHAVRNEPASTAFFDYLENSVTWLQTANVERLANFHLIFLMRLTLFFGIQPNLENPLPFFDLEQGCYVPLRPYHRHFIEGEEARQLATLMRFNFNTMHLMKISREQRQRILQGLLTYYQHHLPNFPELKSVEIMRQIFN